MNFYILMFLLTVLVVMMLLFTIIPKGTRKSSKNIFFQSEDELEAYEKLQKKDLSWSERTRVWLIQSRTGVSFEFYMIIHVIAYVVAFLVSFYVTRILVLSLVAGLLGFFFPRTYVKGRREAMLAKFDDGLLNVLERLITHLRYLNFPQALEKLLGADQIPDLVREELKEMFVALSSGKAEELAIQESYERVGSDALRLMYIQTKLNREVGMRLDELFQSVRESLVQSYFQQEDARIQTREMAMQGNIILWIVGLLTLAFMFVTPDLFRNLTESVGGRAFMLGTAVSYTIGTLLIRRVVRS